MFDQTQLKQLIQAAEQAWYSWPNKQHITHQTREQKKCFLNVFDRMFDGLQVLLNTIKHDQTRSNTIKHDQTRSNSTKQGVQTVKYFITKQCLMLFGRQTFPVCPGPKKIVTNKAVYM